MACSERVVRKFNIVNLHKEDSPGIDLKVVLYVPQGPSANCCTNRKKSDEEPKIEIQERTFSVMVDALDRSNNMVTYKTVFELQEPLALQPKKSTYEHPEIQGFFIHIRHIESGVLKITGQTRPSEQNCDHIISKKQRTNGPKLEELCPEEVLTERRLDIHVCG